MRALVLCCAFIATAGVVPAQAAERSPACDAKRANIESQMAQAVASHRTQELAGLKKALKANQANCTDKSLAAEREQQIRQAQQKVQAREKSLAEAERKGDARKIADRTAKLEAAREDLAEAQKPLLQ